MSKYHQFQPLSGVGRLSVALGSMVISMRNPMRADLIAALGETTGLSAFKKLQQRMMSSEKGRKLLNEKPVISSDVIDPKTLARTCPKGSLGAVYAGFMLERNFSPDERSIVRFVDDEDLAYIILRYRQVHDFWHALVDVPPTVLGELALKWFEWAHTGLPSTLIAGSFGSIQLSATEQMHLAQDLVPWALKTGSQCEDLLCIKYEDILNEDLETLRKEWKVPKAPLMEKFR